MNSKEQKIANFDPNGVGDVSGGIFGLPFTVEESELVIIPTPWEVTVSYSAGTTQGPQAILDASPQLDLFEPNIPDAWKLGVAMEEVSEEWLATSDALRAKAEAYINWLEAGSPEIGRAEFENLPAEVTAKGQEFLQWLKEKSLGY
ncbi:MAG: arginase family protein, partial [Hymenobacteraceae bacterium]|nr:arginase family protein [Hymenobacteraceae bacterium]